MNTLTKKIAAISAVLTIAISAISLSATAEWDENHTIGYMEYYHSYTRNTMYSTAMTGTKNLSSISRLGTARAEQRGINGNTIVQSNGDSVLSTNHSITKTAQCYTNLSPYRIIEVSELYNSTPYESGVYKSKTTNHIYTYNG